MKIRSTRAAGATAGSAALLLVLGACGSSGGSGASAGSGGSDGGAAVSDEAAELVSAAEGRVSDALRTTAEDIEVPPAEPYDVGSKRLMVISCGQGAPSCAAQSEAVVEAAQAAGWETTPIRDAQFQNSRADGFVKEAINEGIDVIVYASSDPNTFVQSARAAAEAGIVQVAFNNPVGDELKDVVIQVTPDNVQRGQLIGDWIIAQSGCEGSVGVFNDPAYAVTVLQVGSTVDRLEECGDSLEITEVDIESSEMGQVGPPFFTAALAQFPSGQMDYAVGPYDTMAARMAVTASDQGRTDVAVTGFDGAPANVELIADGVQAVSVTSPFEYLGWVAIDQAARQGAGLELYDATRVPARLVTAENAGSFPNFWEPEDFDYKTMFTTAWAGS